MPMTVPAARFAGAVSPASRRRAGGAGARGRQPALHHGARDRGARNRAGADARGRARHCGVVGDRRAAPGADDARHRSRRRGDHAGIFVLRDGRNRFPRLGARPVFVDIDPVTFNAVPSLITAAITSAHESHRARPPLRVERRPRSDHRGGITPRDPRCRGCRSGHRRHLSIASGRRLRRVRMLLVFPEQEPWCVRRRGAGHHQRQRAGGTRTAASRARDGAEVLPPHDRRQLPHGRNAGARCSE
mgnify:CR=1 FL=1